MSEISRVVADTAGLSRAVAATMALYSIPSGAWESTDALVVFPGLGEYWRLKDAIRMHSSASFRGDFLLITGLNIREKTADHAFAFNLDKLGLKFDTGVIQEVHAENTKEQADWVCQRVDERCVSSLTLCVSPYHLLRAYMTLLASMNRRSLRIPMIPAPTPVPFDQIIPEVGVSGWDMVPGELRRIAEYQQKGDVASFAELTEYLGWLWQQPIVSQYSAV